MSELLKIKLQLFQSTPSSRKVTCALDIIIWLFNRFQSTPSSRKVTVGRFNSVRRITISIHTFLAEGDCRWAGLRAGRQISIHTFLAEGDSLKISLCCPQQQFQSTPSSRKVTFNGYYSDFKITISIHTFLAEGDENILTYSANPFCISIHTFLAEGDG